MAESAQPFMKAVQLWLVGQIAVCAVNSVFVLKWTITATGAMVYLVAPACTTAIQVILTSLLLRKIRSRSKAACILSGALLGFVMPIGLAFLIAFLPQLSDFNILAVWAMIGCAPSLLGVGLIGGAWAGYARWKSCVA